MQFFCLLREQHTAKRMVWPWHWMSDFGGFLACFWVSRSKKHRYLAKKYPDIECHPSFHVFSTRAYTSIGFLTLPKNGSFLAVFYRISIMKNEKTQIFRQKRPCQNLAGWEIIYYFVRKESEHQNRLAELERKSGGIPWSVSFGEGHGRSSGGVPDESLQI